MRDNDVTKKRVPVSSTNKLGIARKFLGQLQKVYPNISIKFQRITTPDGTEYFVSDYHGRKTIEIVDGVRIDECSMYVETGIYHVPPDDLYSNAQNPVIEYKLTYFPDNTPDWFGEIGIEYEDEAYTISYADNFRIESGSRITNPYDETLSLSPNVTVFNNIIHKHPASKWTGLARLFMQSIYSSYRDDLNAISIGEYLWDIGDVTLGGYLLKSHFNIFRDDNSLTYKVIEVFNTSLVVKTLQLSVCGQTLLEWYRANEASIEDEKERCKIEAYIFSGATIGDKEQIISFDAGAVGSALYYSWKSNSNGTKFAVVTQWQDTTNYQYESTLSEISLNYDNTKEDGERFSVSVLQNTSARYFLTPGIDRLWTPNGTFGGMSMLVPYPFNASGTEPIGGSAPVYCFYEKTDELKIVYFRGSMPTTQGATEEGWMDKGAPCFTDLPSYTSIDSHYRYSHGFDEPVVQENGHDEYREWWTMEHLCGVLGGSCLNTLNEPCCTFTCRTDGLCPGYDPPLPENEDLWPTTSLRGRTKIGSWKIHDTIDSGVTGNGNSMLIIPYDDAAAVFVVNHQERQTTLTQIDHRSQTSAYLGDHFYGSWTQCTQLEYGTHGEPPVPNPRIAPSTCYPSKPADTDWDCCVLEPEQCISGSCRPPQPCGGDGPYSYGLPHKLQWDLMGGLTRTFDGPAYSSSLTEVLYNINGSTSFVGGAWSTMLNAEVWANPFVEKEVRCRTSAVYKLTIHSEDSGGDGVYQNGKYKYYIGWQ